MNRHVTDLASHFEHVAPVYTNNRTTDLAPIEYIGAQLSLSPLLRGIDFGCGSGRYALALTRALPSLQLVCVDRCKRMLTTFYTALSWRDQKQHHLLQADASNPGIQEQTMDCVFSFNAIHHLDLARFLMSAHHLLHPNGQLFLYTRTPEQNRTTIWGRLFPNFAARERKLYTEAAVRRALVKQKGLKLKKIQRFRYARSKSLKRLCQQAQARHYSTFALYSQEEFQAALTAFQERVGKTFTDLDRILWTDENTLYHVIRAG